MLAYVHCYVRLQQGFVPLRTQMVHSDAGLYRLTSERAYEAWYLPRKPAHVVANRFALHDFAANYIGADTEIRYLEFGVHEGYSIRRFASIFSNPAARFVGFDSFEGLPEAWGSSPPGHFSTQGQLPTIADSRVEFAKGWFQNTLREFLPTLKYQRSKTTLVHFDADIYSSTLFILSALWWHIPEYFFIMDELMGQEMAAMYNFSSAYPVDVEIYTREDNSHGHPAKIFGRVRATHMIVNGVG
jgi:O-methyltransferase